MEKIQAAKRLVSDLWQDQAAGIWTTLCSGFHTWKDWLLYKIKRFLGLQCARRPPLGCSLAVYRQMVGWDEAPIRCIVAHPTSLQMAMVTADDTVHVQRRGSEEQLQSPEQVDVYCGAFRPCTDREVAVGCAAGIYIWQRVTFMLWDKRLLSRKAHIHVTSVQWNEDGTLLFSVALGSCEIIVWNPDSGQTVRSLFSEISFLQFSPDFQMLFGAASDLGASVCYTDRRSWKLERILKGRQIQTAAWTACSTYVLFVQQDDTNLYATTRNSEVGLFLKPKLFWTLDCVADLQNVSFGGAQAACHGQPHAIAVDPWNTHLAVIYKEKPFVLLFKLSLAKHTKPRILPKEYVYCDDVVIKSDVFPTCICFSHDKDRITLAIGWNSAYFQLKIFEG